VVDDALAEGELRAVVAAELHALDDDPRGRLRILMGQDRDVPPAPDDDFSGEETFSVDPDSVRAPMRATVAGGALAAGPGRAYLEFPLFGSTPLVLDLFAVRVVGRVGLETMPGGRLGGAIPDETVHSEILPAVAGQINAIIAADPMGMSAQTLLALFDADGDGRVAAEELGASPLLADLLAPDVDLCAGPCAQGTDTGPDGVPDALSIAIGFAGVAARLEWGELPR
jgi:hypothetical protein